MSLWLKIKSAVEEEKEKQTLHHLSHKFKIQFVDGVGGGIVIGVALKGRVGRHDGFKSLIPSAEPGICHANSH